MTSIEEDTMETACEDEWDLGGKENGVACDVGEGNEASGRDVGCWLSCMAACVGLTVNIDK